MRVRARFSFEEYSHGCRVPSRIAKLSRLCLRVPANTDISPDSNWNFATGLARLNWNTAFSSDFAALWDRPMLPSVLVHTVNYLRLIEVDRCVETSPTASETAVWMHCVVTRACRDALLI